MFRKSENHDSSASANMCHREANLYQFIPFEIGGFLQILYFVGSELFFNIITLSKDLKTEGRLSYVSPAATQADQHARWYQPTNPLKHAERDGFWPSFRSCHRVSKCPPSSSISIHYVVLSWRKSIHFTVRHSTDGRSIILRHWRMS